jgi:hypothetical protein
MEALEGDGDAWRAIHEKLLAEILIIAIAIVAGVDFGEVETNRCWCSDRVRRPEPAGRNPGLPKLGQQALHQLR